MRKSSLQALLVCAVFGLTACGGKSDVDIGGSITLGDYKGLEAEQIVYEVTENDIQQALDNYKYEYTEYESVSRPSEKGDEVALSLLVTVDGENVYEYTEEEPYYGRLGETEFGDAFDAKLTGVKTGDSLEFTLHFNDEYEDEAMAGKDASFKATVLDVNQVIEPELTDEFIAENLDCDNMAALREKVTNELKADYEKNSVSEAKDNLMRQVIDNADVTKYSDALYEECKEDVNASYENYMQMFGLSSVEEVYEMFEVTEEDLEEEIQNQIAYKLAVREIVRKEKLTVSDKDYEAQAQQIAEENQYEDVAALEADYSKDDIKFWIEVDRVNDLLYKNAVITEKKDDASEGELSEENE